MKKLSVDKAIHKGQKMVNYPIFTLMIIGFSLSICSPLIFESGWSIPIGFVTTFAIMWLWWSFMITQWRIWAFENCRNVHELKRRAIEDKLIGSDGSFFEKTEIRTTEQRNKLIELENKFQIADELKFIYDDGSIPNETKIYYSKISLAIYWVSGISLFSYGVYVFLIEDILGYFFILVSIFLLYSAYKKAFLKDAPITLNSKGIKIHPNTFIKWEDIEHIKNKFHHSGSTMSWSLRLALYEKNLHREQEISVKLNDLEVSLDELELLIKVYQQRNKSEE